MAYISYVNGRYVNHSQAFVHMEDRGYQFADGIYEVIAFYNRRLLDETLHMARLKRSLNALQIALPVSESALTLVIAELIARNDRTDGTIYIQVTRGVAKRDHPFPTSARSALVMTITGPKSPSDKLVRQGVSVITAPDERWTRCDIKSISLVANVLAKQAATMAGARETWLMSEDDVISEGAVSNSFIVDSKSMIITHPLSRAILGGVTRDVVLTLARKAGIKVQERAFSLKEARAAKEAFLTSTTSNILPVVNIDGKSVGSGKPGEQTLKLLALYYNHIHRQTGKQWH